MHKLYIKLKRRKMVAIANTVGTVPVSRQRPTCLTKVSTVLSTDHVLRFGKYRRILVLCWLVLIFQNILQFGTCAVPYLSEKWNFAVVTDQTFGFTANKTEKDKIYIYIYIYIYTHIPNLLFCFSTLQCTSHQMISVTGTGWRINHVFMLCLQNVFFLISIWGGAAGSQPPPPLLHFAQSVLRVQYVCHKIERLFTSFAHCTVDDVFSLLQKLDFICTLD